LHSVFFLGLLKEVCTLHPLQRAKVLQTIKASFDLTEIPSTSMDAISKLELKKKFLDILVFLIIHGYVLPVLDTIILWSEDEDIALTRYFLSQLFALISPPFSFDFLLKILKIASKIKSGIKAAENVVQILLEQSFLPENIQKFSIEQQKELKEIKNITEK